MTTSDQSDVNAVAATRLAEASGRATQVPDIALDDDQQERLKKAKRLLTDLRDEMEMLATEEVDDAR